MQTWERGLTQHSQHANTYIHIHILTVTSLMGFLILIIRADCVLISSQETKCACNHSHLVTKNKLNHTLPLLRCS